jgi:hypothetical protein
MVLGLTKPLTEISTGNLPRGKGQPVHRDHDRTTICDPTVYKMWMCIVVLKSNKYSVYTKLQLITFAAVV